MRKSILKYYINYHWTHFDRTSWGAHVKHEKELAKYDPVEKQKVFQEMIKEFEDKLTKAKQKGNDRKVKALEQKVEGLISGRLSEYSDFDRQGFGRLGGFASSTHSIRYNENGEATIFVEFKDENVVPLTGAELKKILGERSLNKVPSENVEKKEAEKVEAKQENQPQAAKSTKNELEVIKPANKENYRERTLDDDYYGWHPGDPCACDD